MSAPADEIVRLHHEGLGPRQIAVRLGCSIAEAGAVLVQRGLKRRAHVTYASLKGENLSDPQRANKLLRRFSWEEQ